MKHQMTIVGWCEVGDRVFPNSGRSFVYPSPDKPLPTVAGYFSGEVHTAARLLDDIQDTTNNQPVKFVMPSTLEGLMLLTPRVRRALTPFIPQLRSLYSLLPTLDGHQVKSYHEAAIETAGLWHDWLYRFTRISEMSTIRGLIPQLKRGKDRTDEQRARDEKECGEIRSRIDGLLAAASGRFRESTEPWPFAPVDFASLIAGIEFESDKLEFEPELFKAPDDLIADLTRQQQTIVKFLWGGALKSRSHLENRVWGDTPGTDDRVRVAVDRLNRRLVGGDLDSYRLEIDVNTSDLRLIPRKSQKAE